MELKPGNRAMTTRTVAATTLGLLLVGVAVVRAYGEQHNPSPDPYVFSKKQIVEFEGRITHAQTGEGLADTYVIVNMRSYKAVAYTHHGVSGCRESSQAVKTDANGRYRVHWEWPGGKAGVPSDLSVNVKAFKPGWAHYPRAAKTGSSFLVSMQRDFQMLPSEQPLAERIDTLRRLLGDNCWAADQSPLGIEMAEAAYREAWSQACDQPLPLPLKKYVAWRAVLKGYLRRQVMRDSAPGESKAWGKLASSHSQQIEKLVPDVAWDQQFSTIDTPGVGLTSQQMRVVCDFYSPARLTELTKP